ncbi:MAG: acyl-CoA dehydrogenase [Cyanobacteria bacterium SZAS LIN-3]|nr:acyl-CoA dehydrogenase [Cyanobacteria bacterium SZAS LIN-3]
MKHENVNRPVKANRVRGPSAALMSFMRARKMLPKISATERQALEAGHVWIDGDLFAGKPDFTALMKQPYNKLSAREQAFLEGPCTELCRMLNDRAWDINQTRKVPDEVLSFIKTNGFMGMLIPTEYGGLGFSWLAISTVLQTLNQVSVGATTFVTIANSLSAAELIKHYGTKEQKDHYLPRLASGEMVPCFGLTEPKAGSDAASIEASGVVFKDADGQLKLRMNFEKRYMTLGPVADLTTLACQVFDPEHLLGRVDDKGEATADIGITCVLLHRGTPGFTSGEHHLPIGDPFYNGPLHGKDVVVSMDNIVGGVDGAGIGWRMLMEQLAGGRAISLPAGAIAGMNLSATAASAYSMVRRQFGMSIGVMDGIAEKVAFINGMAYMMEAARVGVCSAIDGDIKPPVVSGALKLISTEVGAETVIAGMDIMAGAGVMQGPSNILGRLYGSLPVGKTVEGASIMTRTMLTYGQGATRCHPYALRVVEALEQDNPSAFRKSLLGWVGHVVLGFGRNFRLDLLRGRTGGLPSGVAKETKSYYRRLAWAASRFGKLTDLALLTQGAKLKVLGMLSGRFCDAFTWMFLAEMALLRYEREGRRKEDLPLLSYSVEYALHKVQVAFEGIYSNFDFPVLGFCMRTLGKSLLRLNSLSAGPSDRLTKKAAATMQTYNDQFKRLSAGTFMPEEDKLGLGRLLKAFRLETESRPVVAKIVAAQRAKTLRRSDIRPALVDEAMGGGVISADEAKLLHDAYQAMSDAITVDTFEPAEFFLPKH